MAIEARNRTLPDWFTRIRTHQTVLPRFQRLEAWGHPMIAQLFNMILRDLPIGAALILDIGNDEPFISRSLEGAPAAGERVTEHLLDGQQRLTALWRGFHNNYEDRTYFLHLSTDPESGMAYYVDSIARWRKKGDSEDRPFWANEPEGQWERRLVPLDLCEPEINSAKRFRDWANRAIPAQDERDAVSDLVSQIRQQFAGFNLPFLSLPATTNKETALDVFVKMNTSAEPLTTYDIVVAQIEATMGKSLRGLVADARAVCPSIADYYAPEDLVLYSSALLQGRAPTNATYLAHDFGANVLGNWDTLLAGLPRAMAFLEQERVFDAARLPTDVVVPVLVAVWALAPDGLDAEGRARAILRRFLWRAFFSTRYESSTNSRAFNDFNELKALVEGRVARSPTIFDEALYPLPTLEELCTAGWPVRRDRLARAILALAIHGGGQDLADGSDATRANLAKREYHHLFPFAHLARQGIADNSANLALNCALVTWRTNRNIADKEPERYLAERHDPETLSNSAIKARLLSHLIPYDEMVQGDYAEFLSARAKLIHGAMTSLCAGGGAVHAAAAV